MPSRLGWLLITLLLGVAAFVSVSFERLRDFVFLPTALEVSTPGPLRGFLTERGGTLTVEGVLAETNRHRAEHSLLPLRLDPTLNQAAIYKVNDMFAQQYFDHVSPSGETPSEVVENAGYQFLRTGENLALGNFPDDAALVQAWMDSPGHRANILTPGFTEIGIAVRRDTFEGSSTWLAVQEFALPQSACPEPEAPLRKQFENAQLTLDQQATTLTQKKTEIDQLGDELETLVKEINRLVAEDDLEQARAKHAQAEKQQAALQQLQQNYNNLVKAFNKQQGETKQLAEAINKQIHAFNTCLEDV